MPTHIADYIPTEDWGDNTKWTNAIMGAFSNALTTYLNDTLVETVNNGQSNIGAVAATTTTTNDSLKITGPDGVTLSTTNFDIELPSDTAQGRYERFTLSSDITLKISGAHWGRDTTGNITGAILRWGFINDGGATPALAIMYMGGRETVASTSCSSTPSSINLPEEVLVNRTLAVGTWPIKEFGYFYVDFTDSTDVWAIQSGIGKVIVGATADGLWQPFNFVQTSGWVSLTATGRMMQSGNTVYLAGTLTGTSNAVTAVVNAPFKASTVADTIPISVGLTVDNGSQTSTGGMVSVSASSYTLTFYKDHASSGVAWTSSGTKTIQFNIVYERA